jgi:hypothetical protein
VAKPLKTLDGSAVCRFASDSGSGTQTVEFQALKACLQIDGDVAHF